ncbi:MAG TPA: aminomethyltransferase family protein [Candidatus Angelobacter sp.]|nr:aminomethyltransferase family protein [Candidatus Angelobacter sp.]
MSNRSTVYHQDLGARLDPGKSPLSYSDPEEEYWTIKRSVGLADVSNAGRLRITGKDRVAFLNGLLTNDVSQLKENNGQRSALLNSKARVLADLHLYAQTDSLLIDTGESPASHVKEILDRFIITEDVQIRDATSDLVQMTVQGPKSSEAIKQVLGADVHDLKSFEQRGLGPSTIIARDRTGQSGYDIILPVLEAEPVWHGFLLNGGELGLNPVGSRALEILRLEAGYPRYAADMDENTIVLEAGFKDALNFTKGCYLGQEVVARATHIGRVNKQLVGLEVDTRASIPPRSKLTSDGKEAGFITSAAFSPGLGKVASLGYANREFAKEGTKVNVQSGETNFSAVVTKIV